MRSFHHYYPTNMGDDWAASVWPRAIEKEFADFRPSFVANTFKFESGSNEEKRFLRILDRKGFSYVREVYFDVPDDQIAEFSHYALMVDSREVETVPFIDYSARCQGEPRGLCRRGVVQTLRPLFRFADHMALDIFEFDEPRQPRILIVSRRLHDLFADMNVKGCEFIACADVDSPRDENLSLAPNPDLEPRSNFFQLLVTAETARPGQHTFLRRGASCASCGEAEFYLGGETGRHSVVDLGAWDFQMDYNMSSPDGMLIRRSSPAIVVTARIVDAIRSNGFRGWSRATSHPEIRYEVVPTYDGSFSQD